MHNYKGTLAKILASLTRYTLRLASKTKNHLPQARYTLCTIRCTLTIIVLLFGAVMTNCSAFAGDEDTLVREYPDGDFGISLGGGYEAMPDGEVLPSVGYREEYLKTKYGPLVGDKFIMFPKNEALAEKVSSVADDEQKEIKDYIFLTHPDAAGSETASETDGDKQKASKFDSALWGVYSPNTESE